MLKDMEQVKSTFERNFNEMKRNYDKEYQCINDNHDIIEKFVEESLLHYKKTYKKSEFKTRELLNLFDVAEGRYKYGVPPGYKDSNKKVKTFDDNRRKYGDYII